MNKIIQFKIQIVFFLLFTNITISKVHSQGASYPWMSGYYNSNNQSQYAVTFDPNITLNEGDKWYSDTDRAEISLCYRPSLNQPYIRIVLTADTNHRHGKFKTLTSVNLMKNLARRFFIVQNKVSQPIDVNGNPDPNGSWTSGNCAEVMIDRCYDSSGLIVLIVSNGGPIDKFFKLNSLDKMFIVRVPIVKIFSLNGGVATCHAWDGHTGGFLPLRAQVLGIKSGFFDAAAKGYFPEDVNWGQAGGGNPGDAVYHGISMINRNKIYNSICPDTLGLSIYNGDFGYEGDPKVATLSLGTITSGIKYKYGLAHTKPFIRPKFGSAGYYITGQKAGDGAQGGGHGGQGGSSQNGNRGNDGNPGESGGNGGEVGKGARGGGIIMLRVESMYYQSGNIFTTPGNYLFYINGQNGQYGGNGGKGGDGGLGGQGANGSVNGNTIYRSGGWGDPGEPGNGATGGDGSIGGNPGTLGLHLKNFYHNIGTGTSFQHLTSVTNSNPGKAGYGGQGGFKGSSDRYDSPNEFYNLPIGYNWCTNGGGGQKIKEICNCDSVFWALSSGNLTQINLISLNEYQYEFPNYFVNVRYDTGEIHLRSIYKNGLIRSHCIMYSDTQCIPMFEKMRTNIPLPNNWGRIDLRMLQAQRVSLTPLVVSFRRHDRAPYLDALKWSGYEGVLYDEMEPGRPICYKANCDSKNPENRSPEVTGGNKAVDGEQAQITEQNDESNIGLYEQWPEYVKPEYKPDGNYYDERTGSTISKKQQVLSIYTPLASFEDDYSYKVINTLGQEITSGKIGNNELTNIQTQNFATGIYNLILYRGSISFVYRFIVN